MPIFASLADYIGVGILLLIYLLPAIVGVARRKRNAIAIAVLNVLLGWTLLFWALALVWSLTVDE